MSKRLRNARPERAAKRQRLARRTVSEEPDIQFILFRRTNGICKLAACSGGNSGCERMKRLRKPKSPCPDCYVCEDEEEMTLEEVQERLRKGDA